MAALRDAFYAFAEGQGMDGRAFVKCLKDAGLLDQRFKTVDADIIFAKCKVKGSRKLNFETFVKALEEVAETRQLLKETVVDFICLAYGPTYESKTCVSEVAGPERFFYDKTLYTGTHKCGGPDVEGEVVTDRGLVNRDRQHEIAASAERRQRATSDLPMLLGRRSMSQAETSPREKPKAQEEGHAVAGPERFYYDSSTYTGTWRHGGPTSSGSGVAKDGYSDLSVLVRRDVVQDDVLQRKRRNAMVGAARSAQQSPQQSPRQSPRQSPQQSPQQSPANRSGSLPTLLGRASPREAWKEEKSEKLKAVQAKPAVLESTVQETKLRVPEAPRLSTRYLRADPVMVPAFSPNQWDLRPSPPQIFLASAGKVKVTHNFANTAPPTHVVTNVAMLQR